MKSLYRIFCLFLFLLLPFFVNAADNNSREVIRLATTTSTENSGLLRHLLPAFEQQSGFRVHVIAVGTGKALRMGRDGDVDVVLVHAPGAEQKFVDAGYGIDRRSVMYNDFVIVGPTTDPANIASSADASEALQRIAHNKSLFISRGDHSGTHKKERHLWHTANIAPAGSWHREAGQGMGKVLQIAGELNAYTLTDRGTWLSYQTKSPLKILFQGDPGLYNPYGIIAINPKRYPDINYTGATALINWITSPEGQNLIGAYTVAGNRLFTPSAYKLSARQKQ